MTEGEKDIRVGLDRLWLRGKDLPRTTYPVGSSGLQLAVVGLAGLDKVLADLRDVTVLFCRGRCYSS